MNCSKLTQEELWQALRDVDEAIKKNADNPLKDLYERYDEHYQNTLGLKAQREEIINVFVECWGYNPDNLCTTIS